MRRRRGLVAPRRPVFLGCEGESEQAYGQILNDLVREHGRSFHIEVVNLNPGAGDPLALVRRAEQEIARRTARRTAFGFQALLIDSDRVDYDVERRRRVEREAADLRIQILWQRPCHEAFLLRHLPGYGDHAPPNAAAALQLLLRAWPDYRKPMTKLQLAKQLSLHALLRASAREPELASLLEKLGLVAR